MLNCGEEHWCILTVITLLHHDIQWDELGFLESLHLHSLCIGKCTLKSQNKISIVQHSYQLSPNWTEISFDRCSQISLTSIHQFLNHFLHHFLDIASRKPKRNERVCTAPTRGLKRTLKETDCITFREHSSWKHLDTGRIMHIRHTSLFVTLHGHPLKLVVERDYWCGWIPNLNVHLTEG